MNVINRLKILNTKANKATLTNKAQNSHTVSLDNIALNVWTGKLKSLAIECWFASLDIAFGAILSSFTVYDLKICMY